MNEKATARKRTFATSTRVKRLAFKVRLTLCDTREKLRVPIGERRPNYFCQGDLSSGGQTFYAEFDSIPSKARLNDTCLAKRRWLSARAMINAGGIDVFCMPSAMRLCLFVGFRLEMKMVKNAMEHRRENERR